MVLVLLTTVSVAHAGARIELVAGATKKHFALLVAGDEGAEYSLPGGIRVRAAAGTVFKVFTSVQNLRLNANEVTHGYSVFVRDGRLDISVPEKQLIPSAVMISASRQTNAIVTKGHATVFSSNDVVVLANRNGQTLARVGAGWNPIEPGSERIRDTRRPTGDVEKTILAPAELKGQLVRAAFRGEVSLGDLRWSEVTKAKAYQVVIVRGDNGKEVVNVKTPATSLETPPSVGPGKYEVRIKALDSAGIDSHQPLARTLRVLGAELPEGSSFGENDDTIYLGARQQVKLSNVAGLKMTYGRANYFIDAPSAVGLYRNEQTKVTFKDEQTGETLRLDLRPRALRADIKLTPRNAVWPRDKVTISVTITDPRGPAASAASQPRFELRLGLKALEVPWKHKGNVWTASVDPQGGDGPWVLRVNVFDEQGASLGRDFVEIDMVKAPTNTVARR